jgi:hypothetical protein
MKDRENITGKKLYVASAYRLWLSFGLLMLALPRFAAAKPRRPFVIQPDKFMVSMPLGEVLKHTPPIQPRPWKIRPEHETLSHMSKIYRLPDPVIQDSTETLPQLAVTLELNFDGFDGAQAGNNTPPDTNGAVGDKEFFLIANDAFEIFDKATGKKLTDPALIHTIWGSQFGGQCGTQDGGDPVVLFDHLANVWLIEQLEYFTSDQICVAVSQTDDATGKWNLYAYTFSNGLPDYPKLGIWPDGYYLAFNFFGPGDGEPCAWDRKAMIAGEKNPALICFTPNSSDMGFLPSDMDGATLPPSGAPNHYVELGNSNTTLNEYDFHVDFKHPSQSTFTGPNIISVPAYTVLCGSGFGQCIPEPAGGSLLDALGDRMMFRNAYRNFGDHESMVFTHAVAPGKNSQAAAAERWYELRSTGNGFSAYQAGTYQNKKDNYWMGSVAMDKAGDIALGFSVDNSTSLAPSIWITGRIPGDPLNKMEGTKVVQKGTKVQTRDNRWGDYSSMSVDPTDDCTLWYTQEYSDGGINWQSHIVSFKFNSCQ